MYRAVSRAQVNRSTSACESRCPLSAELVGFVTFDGYSMHVAPLPVIVVQGVVLHDPVVPHRDGSCFPFDSAGKTLFFAVVIQKREQSLALVFAHSFDSFGKRSIHV